MFLANGAETARMGKPSSWFLYSVSVKVEETAVGLFMFVLNCHYTVRSPVDGAVLNVWCLFVFFSVCVGGFPPECNTILFQNGSIEILKVPLIGLLQNR